MAAQLKVTPGKTWTAESTVDEAALNAAANPTVEVPDRSIGTAELKMDELAPAIEDATTRGTNYLRRGNFWPHTWEAPAGKSCPADEATENAAGWFAQPAGAAATFGRSTSTPDNGRAGTSAQITGAAGVTRAHLKTFLSAAAAGQLQDTVVTVSAYLYNGTGTDGLRPRLEVHTADALDDTANTTLAFTQQAAEGAAAGAWKRFDWQVDTTALTDWQNGAWLRLHVPEGSWLDEGTKHVLWSQVQVEDSPAATGYMRPLPAEEDPTELPADTGFEWLFGAADGRRYKIGAAALQGKALTGHTDGRVRAVSMGLQFHMDRREAASATDSETALSQTETMDLSDLPEDATHVMVRCELGAHSTAAGASRQLTASIDGVRIARAHTVNEGTDVTRSVTTAVNVVPIPADGQLDWLIELSNNTDANYLYRVGIIGYFTDPAHIPGS